MASAALLLLPTTLMGATLPILARVVLDRPGALRKVGGNLGTLYALNLFGALAGCFLAGFVLLSSVGLANTNRIAASVNILLAIGLFILARWQSRFFAPRKQDLDELIANASDEVHLPAELAPVQVSAAARRVVLVGFAVSGATAMIVQVLWTRYLTSSKAR